MIDPPMRSATIVEVEAALNSVVKLITKITNAERKRKYPSFLARSARSPSFALVRRIGSSSIVDFTFSGLCVLASNRFLGTGPRSIFEA